MTDKPNILIIDDEPNWSNCLAMLLERDYNITKAANGALALDILKQPGKNFHVILLDLMMPVMGGVEFLENFRKTDLFANTNIVIQTGTIDHKMIEKALKLGAKACLNKPFGYKELHVMLKRFV